MSDLVPVDLVVPAHLAGRINQGPSQLTQDLIAGVSTGAPPRISIRAGRFRIVEGGVETVLPDTTLNVMILKSNPALVKTYYQGNYDPNAENSAPTCFSTDGKRPDATVAAPQSDTCSACPHAAWGSKISPTGAKIKACTDSKRIAVVPANDLGGKIYQLVVPAASIRPMVQYAETLMQRGVGTDIVKTEISFDLQADFPKLKFRYAAFVTEEEAAIVANRLANDSAEIDALVGVTPGHSAAPAPAPAPAPALAAPAPAPEPAPWDIGCA